MFTGITRNWVEIRQDPKIKLTQKALIMTIINKNIFYSIIIFSVFKSTCVADLVLDENAAKKLGKHAAIILAPKLPEISSEFLHKAAKEIAESNAKIAETLAPAAIKIVEIGAPALVDSSKYIGAEAMKALADSNVKIAEKIASVGHAGVAVAGVGVAIYGITQLYPIAKEIKESLSPNPKQEAQQKADTVAALERLDDVTAKREFRKCLSSNRTNPDRGPSGLPTVCEVAAEMFATAAGQNEVDRMTAVFNHYRKK